MFAGRRGSDYITVCDDGELTYRGDVGVGQIQLPATQTGPTSFTVDAGSHTFTITKHSLKIMQGTTLSSEIVFEETSS